MKYQALRPHFFSVGGVGGGGIGRDGWWGRGGEVGDGRGTGGGGVSSVLVRDVVAGGGRLGSGMGDGVLSGL